MFEIRPSGLISNRFHAQFQDPSKNQICDRMIDNDYVLANHDNGTSPFPPIFRTDFGTFHKKRTIDFQCTALTVFGPFPISPREGVSFFISETHRYQSFFLIH